MKEVRCKYEPSVLDAFKTNSWDDTIRLHFNNCKLCQEHIQLWKNMQEFSERTREQAPDIAYGLVWLKAQFQEKYLAQERALKPLVAFQVIAATVFSVIFLVLVALNWQVAQTSFKALISGSFANLEMTGLVLGLISLFCAILFLGTMFFITSSSFAKE